MLHVDVWMPYVRIINDYFSKTLITIKQWSKIYLALLLTAVLLMISKFILAMCRGERHGRKLGQRPVHTIHDKKQLLKEIHYAACYCNEKPWLVERCMALLTRFPAACNLPLPNGNYTPFMRVCYNGCTELISYMLKNGAEVNSPDPNLDPPFYLATYSILAGKCASYEPLKLLIAAGAAVNVGRRDGYTALHGAASRGDSRLVRWLLSHGADVDPGTARFTPHRIALDRGHLEAAALLRVTTEEAPSCGHTTDNARLPSLTHAF